MHFNVPFYTVWADSWTSFRETGQKSSLKLNRSVATRSKCSVISSPDMAQPGNPCYNNPGEGQTRGERV